MELPKEAIEEFKKIYREEFGEDLSDKMAYDKAMGVLQLFSILLSEDKKSGQRAGFDKISN